MKIEEKLTRILGQGRVRLKEPLSLHTTFRIGGPADFYFEAYASEELVKALGVAQNLGLPYFILGGGSNTLIGDKGFRGLVIKNKSKKIRILGYGGRVKNLSGGKLEVRNVLVETDSGVPLNQLVRFAIEEGLGGLEEFLGLPGTVGGAVVCNAHWQDKKIQDSIISKKTFGKEILLSAIFRLKRERKEILWERARKVVEYRQKTQPLAFPSVGCIFKNIKKSEAARIGTPDFTTSAGFLIEAAGLSRVKIGHVQISPIHANFIVNLDGGKAADVLKLISLIKERIREKFGVNLEEEIIKTGDF